MRILARRRRVIGAVGAVLAAILAIGIVTVTAAPGSSRGAGSPAAPAGSTTVRRRDLVATDTVSGTLSYASPQTVFNRLSGTVTWLPAVGQTVKPGHTLYDVDNQSVTLMNGSTPAFRDLSAADSPGPDILELNRSLHSLGFDSGETITGNDTWQTATTDAVMRWQGSLGRSETGSITLGQVVFLPGAQRVTAIDATLGGTGGGSGGAGSSAGSGASSASSGGSAQGASTTVAARPEFVSLTKAADGTGPTGPTGPARQSPGRAPGSKSTAAQIAELKALTALLKAELQELRSSRASSAGLGASPGGTGASRTSKATSGSRSAGGSGGSSGSAASGGSGASSGSGGSAASSAGAPGSGGGSAQAIMQTSSTQLVVTVDLDASKQSEAVVGEPVTVEMPNSSVVRGSITAVSPVAQSSSSSSSGSGGGGSSGSGGSGSSSSGATIPVTVALTQRLPSTAGLDQAAVSVNFEQQVENNVLSVPVTALLATQGGGYALQEAAAPHRLVPVTPGLFAAGYVQVSGAEVYPGLQVTDSQG